MRSLVAIGVFTLTLFTAPIATAQSALGVAPVGPPGQPSLVPIFTFDGALPFDRAGYSIARLPDLDGDGFPEILVGSPNRDPKSPKPGRSYVLSGFHGSVLRVHVGVNYADRFGRAVSPIGDLDGDGISEYAIGATWAVSPLGPSGPNVPGTATLYRGATGDRIDTLGGIAEGECFGGGFAPLGDVNADGVPDFAVAARFGGCVGGDPLTAYGHVRVLSGTTFSTMQQIEGAAQGDFLGGEPTSTCAVGDIDNDGLVDYAAGAWNAPGFHGRGRVALVSSASGILRWLEGADDGDHFGWALCAVGDLDGDGFVDVAVGAPRGGSLREGQVTVHSTRNGVPLFTFTGSMPNAGFGFAVDAVTSVNANGRPGLVVGSPYFQGHRGKVDLIDYRRGVVASVLGEFAEDAFGCAVAQVSDPQSQRTQFAVGAIDYPANLEFGRVTVFAVK